MRLEIAACFHLTDSDLQAKICRRDGQVERSSDSYRYSSQEVPANAWLNGLNVGDVFILARLSLNIGLDDKDDYSYIFFLGTEINRKVNFIASVNNVVHFKT